MSVRLHDLAKQLNMENKELMELLKGRGYVIKSASSTVDNISADALREEYKERITVPLPPPPPPPPPKPAPVAPPAGIIKTAEDLERERKEREAAEAAAKAARAALAQPTPAPAAPPTPSARLIVAPRLPAPPQRAAPALPPRPAVPAVRAPVAPVPAPAPAPRLPAPAAPVVRPPASLAPQPKPLVRPPTGPAPAKPAALKSPAPLPAPATPPAKPPTEAPAADEAAGAEPGERRVVQIKPPIIVRDFAQLLNIKPFKLISELMEMGIFASMNQAVEEEVAQRLAKRHGCVLEIKHRGEQVPAQGKKPEPPPEDDPKNLAPRPPVVCVLGHVNHGKTSLLDAIRQTNVVAGEAGGITQHTGAYQVEHKEHKLTFLDTPGHAAFSKMRERGARLTDVAVLVVAADDGFMPQTDEALQFAQQAGVPVVVAINKTDAKGANIDRVKQAMQQRGITSEDWGGETLCVPISALKREHIPELLDAVLLQAEMQELQANPKSAAEGVVVESQVEIGRGATATVIVQKGTLKPGAALACGREWCKVRAMVNDRNEPVKAAPPGTPVRLLGWSGAPEAGAKFRVVKHEREAKAEAEAADRAARRESLGEGGPPRVADLDALLKAIHETKQKTFRCVIKGDVHGTVEALEAALLDIKSEKVAIEVVGAEVGPVGKNDIVIASAAGAAIVAFNVKLENGAAPLAKHQSVRLIQHDIIYELIKQVREAMAELLDPELRENKIGAAEVRQVFPLAKGFVAGCMVTEGRVARDGHARLLRAGKVVFTGRVGTLKRFKDDASEVRAGYECGIRLEGCDDYQPGDTIECFEVLQIRPQL